MKIRPILVSFVVAFGLQSTIDAQTNRCSARACDCDGSCVDACEPMSALRFDNLPSGLSDERVPKQPNFEPGQPNILLPFEIQSWQLEAAPEWMAMPTASNRFRTGRTYFTIGDQEIESDEQPEPSSLDVEMRSKALSTLDERDEYEQILPERAQAVFEKLKFDSLERGSLFPKNGPDFIPADPGLGSGDTLSDITKQTRPRDILRCKSTLERASTPVQRTCSQSVERLCDGGCSNDDIQTRYDNPLTKQSTKAMLADYDNRCLDNSNRPDKVAKPEFDFAYIQNRTGALFINPAKADRACASKLTRAQRYGDPFVFCSAAITDSDTILSARHCFIEGRARTPAHVCLASGAVEFRSFAQPEASYAIHPFTDPEIEMLADRSEVAQDFVELTPARPIDGIESVTRQARAPVYAAAMIVGYHDLVVSRRSESEPDWLGKVRWSRPHCSFIRSVGPCAVTKCQTISGFSGVPVWSVSDDGETQLSAIQSEGGSASFASCLKFKGEAAVGAQGNLAISGFIDSEE